MPAFDKRSARRIVDATRRVELNPRNAVRRALGPRIAWGAKLAITTATISLATSTTLGSGAATLQTLKSNWTWAAMGGTEANVQIGNMSTSTTIPSGSLVVVIPLDGMWVIDVVVC